MKCLAVLSAAVVFFAGLAATSALAKGASEATITGPGLGDGIRLVGEGQVGGAQLLQLAEGAGFFPAVFLRSPNPMLSARPQGDLGPRYTITYAMPGPAGVDELRQDLHPYAVPSPVSYTQPGQRFFGTEKTVGGWYVATSALKDDLIAAGLPEGPPPPADGGGIDVPWTVVVAAALVALVAVGVAAFGIWRRPRAAAA